MSSMPRTLLLSQFLVAWLGCVALSAHAADAADAADKRDAMAWLKMIQVAAQKQNYIGTFVFQQANQVRTSRVTHVLDGKTELEKLEILDGRPRIHPRQRRGSLLHPRNSHGHQGKALFARVVSRHDRGQCHRSVGALRYQEG